MLLADHLMRRGVSGLYAALDRLVVAARAMCAKRDMPYAETLTGFKWISRAGDGSVPLVFGYEEALGYCVAPDLVRDKDGISAALLIAELAAGLQAPNCVRSPTGWTRSPPSSASTAPISCRYASTTWPRSAP